MTNKRAPLGRPRPLRGLGAGDPVGRFLVALMAAVVGACAAPPAHRVIMQRHLDARGGRAILEELKVIERSGTFTLHGMKPAATGTYHTCLKYADRVIVDIDAGPVQVHQVLGDHGAFECDATFKACTPAPEGVISDLKKTAEIANREELGEAIPSRSLVEPIYEGTVQVGYKYKKEDRIVEEEFSPDTGLLRRVRSGTRERRYSNWKEAGGVLIPMRIEDSENDEKTVTIALTSAVHSETPSTWCLERFAVSAGGQPGASGDGARPAGSHGP